MSLNGRSAELSGRSCEDAGNKQLWSGYRGAGWVSDLVVRFHEQASPAWWKLAFAASLIVFGVGLLMVVYLVTTGLGVWGLGHPVMWGWATINFVWWIGIGHAGTLISAILFLMRQHWRTAVSRVAESMTIFAVICAAIFPIIHVGRMWYVWWLLPIPTSNAVWPQFHSPLVWDVFAVGTYFTVSILFWYLGMVPDLAILRESTDRPVARFIYSLLSLGWTGSHRHWHHYQKAYLVLAGLATALVVSVHSIVSLDFAATQLPGWHSTIFPPYFVAGAMFSGFGMVLTLIIPIRRLCGLEKIVTHRHIDILCKATLATGSIVLYASVLEILGAWMGGRTYERFVMLNRIKGPYWWAFVLMVSFAFLAPQAFWFRSVRSNLKLVWLISVLTNIGMWCERFVIVVGSLHRDFLPSSWSYYKPTWVDVCTFLGSFGLFFACFLLFLRFLPVVAVSELKAAVHEESADDADKAPALAAPQKASAPEMSSRKQETTRPTSPQYGLLAEFTDPAELVLAARQIRSRGFRRWDVFCPYPVPGISSAMGLKNSPVGLFGFIGGLLGFVLANVMIWYMNGLDYPLLVGGKPFFSPVSAFPTAYELAILCAALATFAGFCAVTALPCVRRKCLKYPEISGAVRDRFFVLIKSDDPMYSYDRTRSFLKTLGAAKIVDLPR